MHFPTLVFAIFMAYAYAQVYRLPSETERYPDNFIRTWHTNAGRGKLFGTLGSTDGSLFGRAGYKQDIFNDHRGHLEGMAYGSRVLGQMGDSSSLGAQLGWSNDNAKVTADLNRDTGGRTGITVTGDGGNLQQTLGQSRPEVGLEAKIVHDF